MVYGKSRNISFVHQSAIIVLVLSTITVSNLDPDNARSREKFLPKVYLSPLILDYELIAFKKITT